MWYDSHYFDSVVNNAKPMHECIQNLRGTKKTTPTIAPTTQSKIMTTTTVVLELSPLPWDVEKSLLLEGIACLARSCEAVKSSSRAVPPLICK